MTETRTPLTHTLFNDFAKYVSLNILGMLGLSCYILADTYFISKGLGTKGLTALNLAIPIYSFIHGSGLMIGMGGATKYSIRKSQKDYADANRTFTHALILTVFLALFFFLTGLLGSEPITRLLGADATVFQMTNTYLRMILLFAPAFMLNNLLLCFVRNDGSPQLSMAAMLGGSLSNIALDYIFIFPLQMGIFGAVLATCMAPFISILILLPFFVRKQNHFHATKSFLHAHEFMDILSVGLPSLITEVSSGIVMIIFNIIILNLEGNIGIAAYGIIANLSLVIISIYTGIAQGIQPLFSSNHGSGNHANIRITWRYAVITTLTLSLLIYGCLFIGADIIAAVFNSEGNKLLQKIATNGLKLYFTACPFAGFNIILSVYFTSTECGLPAHVISLLRGFILIIPMAFLLSAVAGLTGVWYAFPATEFLVSMVGILLLYFTIRRFGQS
uniref:MATE family efflux transporter n=1 Tax=Acetatifactor sp. TaxID=1872090 RepID=UPI004057ACF5